MTTLQIGQSITRSEQCSFKDVAKEAYNIGLETSCQAMVGFFGGRLVSTALSPINGAIFLGVHTLTTRLVSNIVSNFFKSVPVPVLFSSNDKEKVKDWFRISCDHSNFKVVITTQNEKKTYEVIKDEKSLLKKYFLPLVPSIIAIAVALIVLNILKRSNCIAVAPTLKNVYHFHGRLAFVSLMTGLISLKLKLTGHHPDVKTISQKKFLIKG